MKSERGGFLLKKSLFFCYTELLDFKIKMDIQNLSQNNQTSYFTSNTPQKNNNSKAPYIIIVVLAIGIGFGLSRLWPLSSPNTNLVTTITQGNVTSADDIKSADQLVVGQSYGDTGKTFTDTATGTLVKGGINGEGTHTLQREGGKSQYAALTSSTVDLDLFVGKKVEIKGETNASTKAGWFLDVGIIKILE